MARNLAENELDMDLEKESGGGFERFMFFLIPIVFTIVLVGVLLTLFNMDFRSEMISLGNKIPIVKNWIPEPKDKVAKSKEADQKAQSQSSEATIQQLKADLVPSRQKNLKRLVMPERLRIKRLQNCKIRLVRCKRNRNNSRSPVSRDRHRQVRKRQTEQRMKTHM